METPVTATIWAITAGFALLVVGADLAWAFARRNRVTSVKESVGWTLFYITAAISFGFFLIAWQNPIVSEEYFATWVTQYPLSIDNLFVFIIILAKLNIPREKQQLALLSGILFALVLRVIFLFVAIEAIERFVWLFFFFAFIIFYPKNEIIRFIIKSCFNQTFLN